MKKLRWVIDDESWDVDVSTPRTIDGVARPAASLHSHELLPLGLSRGTELSRHKQVHFFQKFMAAPFVPSFSTDRAFSLQRVLTLPFGNDWFVSLLGSFNLQKFVSSVKKESSQLPLLQRVKKHLRDKSFYAAGYCSEVLLSPDATFLVSYEAYGDTNPMRKKAVYHHEFRHQDLLVEAVSPGLFVDEHGTYWDVPLLMAADLASVPSDSGPSYRLSMHHISGPAKQLEGNQSSGRTPSAAISPGLSLKGALSFKGSADIWRSQADKLKLVQPYDAFLSDPHISASGIIGLAATASIGDRPMKLHLADEPETYKQFRLSSIGEKSAILADLFGTLSVTAQHGNFQRLFLDLTRVHARLDFPSGSRCLSAMARLAQDLYKSQDPTVEALRALHPKATVSLQQQIVGPVSFRVDSSLAVDLKSSKEWEMRLEKPVFALEYALQVLGSAKAIAWYAPEQKEFMMELRFFET